MEILKKIKDAFDHLTTLEIVTAVGKPKQDADGNLDIDLQGQAVMFTQIRLLQGDVKTSMDEAYATGNLKELHAFHQARVADGHKIVRDNIAALKDLYLFALSLGKEDKQP